MSKEDKLVPANQTILIEKAIDFLNFSAEKDEKFIGPITDSNYRLNKDYLDQIIIGLKKLSGICAGSSALKARCVLITRYQKDDKSSLPIHNNDWFKRTRKLLAEWSPEIDKEYTDEQINDIFLFIEQIILAQNYKLYFSQSKYFDIDTLLPVLTDKAKIPEFKSIGKIFGFYSADDLTRILNSILKKDRFIFLASHNHVGLLYINDNNNIEFFDINHDKDDIIYEDLSSVVNYFSSNFPELRTDALLPLRLYAFTTNKLDKNFPSVHEIAKLCENNEIAYSPKIPGYLGGISSIKLSSTQEYGYYFADQILAKTNSLTKRLILIATRGSEKHFDELKMELVDIDLNVTDHLGQNMLIHAIIGKRYSFVELLLKEKIKLNMQDIFGWTALMYVAVRDNVEIFTQLLSAGCDPLIKDKSGKSVITHIQEAKNPAMMDALLSHQFPGGKNILMEAVIKKDMQSISELLTVIDVNSRDQKGRTALFYAAVAGQEEIVKTLLLAGADFAMQDKSSKTVRHYTEERNQHAITSLIDWWIAAKKILERAADDGEKFSGGKTPLMIASRSNDICIYLISLVESKVDVNAEDAEDRTALFYAAAAGHVEAVKILLLAGADASMQDRSGKTAKEYAEDKNHQAVTLLIGSWLAGKTVEPSPHDDSKSIFGGKTPLMIASKNNDISGIKKLLESKVDVNATDEAGRTALFYAAAAGHEQAVNELLNAGADPLIADKSSKTARYYACINKKLDLMYQIMEAEIDAELPKPASPSSSPRDKNRHVGIFNETILRTQSGTTESSRHALTT